MSREQDSGPRAAVFVAFLRYRSTRGVTSVNVISPESASARGTKTHADSIRSPGIEQVQFLRSI